MYVCNTTGGRTGIEAQTLHRISSDIQLLSSRDREWAEQLLQNSERYEALEQVAGLQFEASAATARGFSETESTGTTTGTKQPSSELQTTQTRLPDRSADKSKGGENAEKIANQLGAHEFEYTNRPIRARVGSSCVSCERVEKLLLVPPIGSVQHSRMPPAENLHASASNAGQS